MRVSAIIPAAGIGKRFHRDLPKQFLTINDKPILAYTLQRVHACEKIDAIYLVVPEDKIRHCEKEVVGKEGFPKVKKVIAGGRERQDSVYHGIRELDQGVDIVVIHDGVRPFVDPKMFSDVIDEAEKYGAAITAIPEIDTVKKVSAEGTVEETLDRESVWRVQTPQAFQYDIIKKAFEEAFQDHYYGTDDSSLVERAGYRVKVIPGKPSNIKITTPEDLEFGRKFLGV